MGIQKLKIYRSQTIINKLYPSDMFLSDEISKRLDDFKAVCSNHGVKYLYAFGSSTTDRFDPHTSDIDLLVEIDDSDPIERGEKLISLWDTFEDFLIEKLIYSPIHRYEIHFCARVLIPQRF